VCTLMFLPSPHFLECNLGKNTQRFLLVFFCFYSRINMVGAKDALEFDMEEGFFFK
jgi:hypothetical protein